MDLTVDLADLTVDLTGDLAMNLTVDLTDLAVDLTVDYALDLTKNIQDGCRQTESHYVYYGRRMV